MPNIDINNTNYFTEIQGQGNETIVFAHGLLFNLNMFDKQVEKLQSEYQCIRFDFRGQGQSEVSDEGNDLDSLTEDVAALIKKLDCQPCHFVGFSMGGMVGIRLAARYPELLKKLILIDTSSEPEEKNRMPKYKLLLWIAKNLGLKIVANKVMKMFFGFEFKNDITRKAKYNEWKSAFIQSKPRGVINAVRSVIYRKTVTPLLGNIQSPTLIIIGEHDHLTSMEKAQIMHKHIEGSKLKVVPRSGHMSPIEEPEIITDMISEFLHTNQSR